MFLESKFGNFNGVGRENVLISGGKDVCYVWLCM